MADQDGKGGVRLRVDRLAAAMDAARARARAQHPQDGSPDRQGDATAHGASGDAGAQIGTGVPVADDAPAGATQVSGPARSDVSAASPAPRGRRAGEPSPAHDAAPPSGDDALAAGSTGAPGAGTAARHPGDPSPVAPDALLPDVSAPAVSDVGVTRRHGPPPPLLLTPAFHSPESDAGSAPPREGARRVPAPRAGDPAADPGCSGDPMPTMPRRPWTAQDGAPPTIVVPAAPMPPQPRDPARAAALLSLTGVSAEIGRNRVLQDVTFAVPKGAVTLLLGRKGAGKTTVLRTAMGLMRPRAGRIALAGARIDGLSPHRIARAGVGYVPQSMGLFADLTVAENIALGSRAGPVMRDRLDWLTGLFPPLATRWRSPAGDLPNGAQRMLALARALVQKRRLYLIDDPTCDLTEAGTDTLIAALRDLRLQGATILLATPDVAVARALGDACVALERGRIAWTGAMADIADDEALRARMAGLRPRDTAA